jgi:hypothetical protein
MADQYFSLKSMSYTMAWRAGASWHGTCSMSGERNEMLTNPN